MIINWQVSTNRGALPNQISLSICDRPYPDRNREGGRDNGAVGWRYGAMELCPICCSVGVAGSSVHVRHSSRGRPRCALSRSPIHKPFCYRPANHCAPPPRIIKASGKTHTLHTRIYCLGVGGRHHASTRQTNNSHCCRRSVWLLTYAWTFSAGSLPCPALGPALWRTRTKLRNRFLRSNPIELEPTLQEQHRPNSRYELAVQLHSLTPIVHRCSKPSKDDLFGP